MSGTLLGAKEIAVEQTKSPLSQSTLVTEESLNRQTCAQSQVVNEKCNQVQG